MNQWIVNPDAECTAETLICSLAGMCDGAYTVDGSGFNRLDTSFGHSLAKRAMEQRPWTAKQATAALNLLRKYQRQLGGKGFMDTWLTNPVFRNKPIDPAAVVPSVEKPQDRKLVSRDTLAVFQFNYNVDIVAAIKTIRGTHKDRKFWAAWDPNTRVWTVPVNETSIKQIMDVAIGFDFSIEERFINYAAKIQEKTAESHTMLALNDGRNITVAGDTITISVDNAAILAEFEKELLGV